MSRNGSRLYLHNADAVGIAGIPVPAVFNSVAIQSPPPVYGIGSTDALKKTGWGATIINTSAEAPRLMDFDRGSAVYPNAAAAALELPKATTDASTVLTWRIAHMQFVGPALDAVDIPAGAWEFGCAWEMTSNFTFDDARLEMAIYVIDSAGDVVGLVNDTDKWYSIGNLRTNFISSSRFLVQGAAISVPKGGRVVFELWWRFTIYDDKAVTIANLTFFYDGFDDDIPWDNFTSFWDGAGSVGVFREETLEEQVASYLQSPVMLRALVFDAMRDAAQPTTVTREYATAVTTGRTGQEQRMQTRVDPVLGMTATFSALNAGDAQSLDALTNMNSEAGYKLPWWPEVQSLAADLASGSTVIPCVTDGVSFVEGGEAIIYRGPGDYEMCTIESIATDGLTLDTATLSDWAEGTGLMPIVRALLVQDTSLARTAGFANSVPLTFVVAKREAIGAETAITVSGGGGGATCTPALSGLGIGSDFEMGLCDVATIADVIAMSAQISDGTTSNDLGNEWPVYTSGKRMSGIIATTLVDDATSANGARKLVLGSDNVGTALPQYWQNLSIPFPLDTYPNAWVRFLLRNIDADVTFGFGSAADFFQGLSFTLSSSDNKIYITDFAGTGIDFSAPLTPAILSTDLVEFGVHVTRTADSIDSGGAVNIKDETTSWDLYVKVGGTVYSSTGNTGVATERHPVSNNNANAYADWQLGIPQQVQGSGTMEVHGWEFVDGSAHSNPFGY